MTILQKRLFKNSYKKLHVNQYPEVDAAIHNIFNNPNIGQEKKGDLVGVRVYKFSVQNELFLLAYEVKNEEIILLALGSHENFYKKLK